MTPNGAVIFAGLTIVAAMAAGLRGIALVCAVAAAFALIEIRLVVGTAFHRALVLMLPLAAFMTLVWVGIVGSSPAEIAAGSAGTRSAALAHVATVSLRLFVVVFVMQAVVLCFRDESPFSVIRSLRVPLGTKRILVMTLSLIETLRHSVMRSHAALVASGVITRQISLRNALHGWVLIQSVWLTAITTVLGRLRDKWPAEDTLARLNPALAQVVRPLSRADWIWAGAGCALLFATLADWAYDTA